MSELQWGIYKADLNPVRGSEQAGTRPVLIISRESLNRALPVVGVCPVTSRKPGRRVYPTETVVPAGVAGLTLESLVLGHQIRTLAKERLGLRIGVLEGEALRESVRQGLRLFLSLDD